MQLFSVRHKSFVLMLLAAILLFATGRTAHAQLTGDQFQFTVPDPTSLGQYAVTAQPVLAPFDPGVDILSNTAHVGPTALGYMTMNYFGTDGYYHRSVTLIGIDNTSGAMTVTINGRPYPVATLADVFSALPAQPAPFPAQLFVAVQDPIVLRIAPLAGAVVGRTYITDMGAVVTTLRRGHPTAPDLTAAQAEAIINAAVPGLYNKLTVVDVPTWSYDCHGYTFTSGRRWINDDQVPKILQQNGYNRVPAGFVRVGDAVIYTVGGSVFHSGEVTGVLNGAATVVISKWGHAGLYLHAPGDVMPYYGVPSYWRSARAIGNLLRTLP